MNTFLSGVFISDVTVDDNWIQSIKDFINGFKNFLAGLTDVVHIIFPFFTPGEIVFVITALIGFFGLLIYLLIRKVTI